MTTTPGPGTPEIFVRLRIPALIILIAAALFFLWDLTSGDASRFIPTGALAAFALVGFLVINREALKVINQRRIRALKASQRTEPRPPAQPVRRNAASLPKRAKRAKHG